VVSVEKSLSTTIRVGEFERVDSASGERDPRW